MYKNIVNLIKEYCTLFNVVEVVISLFLLGMLCFTVYEYGKTFQGVLLTLLLAVVYGGHCKHMMWMKYGCSPYNMRINNENN